MVLGPHLRLKSSLRFFKSFLKNIPGNASGAGNYPAYLLIHTFLWKEWVWQRAANCREQTNASDVNVFQSRYA